MNAPQTQSTLIDAPDPAACAAAGAELARHVGPGDTIFLIGPLGAGKSTFARGFIRAAADEAGEIPSPTYTLVQTYEGGPTPVWHADLYRLEAGDGVIELGLLEAMDEAIVLIEWPDRLGPYMPTRRIEVVIEPLGGTARLCEPLAGAVDGAPMTGADGGLAGPEVRRITISRIVSGSRVGPGVGPKCDHERGWGMTRDEDTGGQGPGGAA